MNYFDFFDEIFVIWLCDFFVEFFGVSVDGVFEYCYLDVVKLVGYFCFIVVVVWNMSCFVLFVFYLNEMLVCGDIRVVVCGCDDEGVIGVIGNVVVLIIGVIG